jgi:hypothetical protein
MPTGIARLLVVVQALLAYGRTFTEALKQPGHVFDYPLWRRFGSNDITVILSRLTRALLRAAALEKLLAKRAAKGLEVKEPPPRKQAARKPPGAILADICRDLGVLAGDLDPNIWRELQRAITIYGGSAMRLFDDMTRRCLPLSYAMAHKILPVIPPGATFDAPATGPP